MGERELIRGRRVDLAIPIEPMPIDAQILLRPLRQPARSASRRALQLMLANCRALRSYVSRETALSRQQKTKRPA